MSYVVIKLFREKYKQGRGFLVLAHLIDSLPYMHKDMSSISGINVLFSCLSIVTNYLEKKRQPQKRKEEFGSRLLGSMIEKAWWQEHEDTGHIASSVRK